MVQRKAPSKLAPQTEPRNIHVKAEKHQLCPQQQKQQQQQDTKSKGGGGGGDLKMQMKKVRPIKPLDLEVLKGTASKHKQAQPDDPAPPRRISLTKATDGSPNYMKPTSSSDARKEQLQVTLHPQAATTKNKNRWPRNSTHLNHSKPSTSSSGSGLKHIKILSRKSSFRLVRPSIKKTSELALYPNENVNNPTCSSTLKDSKFPKFLDLNPGGTEAEGTSALRVCPYNYCSLNGHWHAPLPPLKAFMSARRNLLKTQKSFKLKGQPSFRVKGEKKIDTGQAGITRVPSGLQISPLIEEVVNDFFVEIYAKPKQQIIDSENCDGSNTEKDDSLGNLQILNRLSEKEDDDDWQSVTSEVGEDKREEVLDQMDGIEIYPDIDLEDDIDKKSEISTKEMDALMNFLEYVECDQPVEVEAGSHPSLVPQDYEEWCIDCCVFDVLGNRDEGLAETEIKMSAFEATHGNWEEKLGPSIDNNTNCFEHPDDVLGPISIFLQGKKNNSNDSFPEPDIASDVCETAEHFGENYEEDVENCNIFVGSSERDDADFSDGKERSEIDVPSICNNKASEISDTEIHNQSTAIAVQDPKLFPLEPLEENGQNDILMKEESVLLGGEGNMVNLIFLGCNEESSEDQGEVSETEDGFSNKDTDNIHIFMEIFEPATLETKNLNEEILDHTILTHGTKEEERREDEVEETSQLLKHQHSEPCEGSMGIDKDMGGGDHIQIELEMEKFKYDETTEDPSPTPEIHNPSSKQSDEEGIAENRAWQGKEQEQEEISGAKESISKATAQDSIEIDGIGYDAEYDAGNACLLSFSESSNEDKTIRTARPKFNKPLTDASNEPKLRLRIIRKNRTEEPEEIKEFNPRSPRFLPVEPDPEAEKVDLRHQMMDEKKNAEEWMLDYALQRAVSKLAPARKRKVELLVAAFETVAPRPMFEEPLRHATSGFDLARHIQACS